MYWEICIWFSIGLLILSIADFMYFISKRSIIYNKSQFAVIIGGTGLAVFAAFLPLDFSQIHNGVEAVFVSLFHAMRVFILNEDYFLTKTILEKNSLGQFTWYYSLLFALAPILTATFILSVFSNVISNMKYFMLRFSNIYVFSELNERSILLAADIKNHKEFRSTIVFTNVSLDDDSSFLEKASKIRAICISRDILKATLNPYSKKNKSYYFFISSDEDINLNKSIEFANKYNSKQTSHIYILSTQLEGELLLGTLNRPNLIIRRINEVRSLIYNNLYNNSIFENANDNGNVKLISFLVIGAGNYGIEMIKALSWCGQMKGYELEINVIDKSTKIESALKAMCPEFIEKNGIRENGEAYYRINFLGDIDIDTDEFIQTVSALNNTTMVFVATGSDDQNIRTAVNLRIIFDRIGINPKIQAVVKDDLKAEMVSFNELKNYHEDNYDIKFVGNIKSLFTYENILCPQLEEPARKLHIMWTDSIKNKKTRQEEIEKALKSFEQYEYYRRSSTSSAIHEKWYTKCGMYDSDISDVEHKRWNVYMRTEGYKFSGSIDKRTRKDRAKLHNLLVPIDQLPPKEVEKDVKTNSKTMKERG